MKSGQKMLITSQLYEPLNHGSLSSRLCRTAVSVAVSDVENRWELGDGLEGRTVGTTIAEFYWWTIASNYTNINQSVSWSGLARDFYFSSPVFSFTYLFACKTVDLKLNLVINN